MYTGVKEAKDQHINKITTAGDSQVAIQAVETSAKVSDWIIDPIGRDTRLLLNDFESWSIRNIHPDHN